MKWFFNFLLLLFTSISCSRVEQRVENLTQKIEEKVEGAAAEAQEKTRRAIENQTQNVVDKVFLPFDHDRPDTENNRQRFRDFLKVEIKSDVKNIYCFDDAVGIDADYMFSFECNAATFERIKAAHQFQKIDKPDKLRDDAAGLQHDFDWWDKKRMAQLDRYSWVADDGRFSKYFGTMSKTDELTILISICKPESDSANG